MPIPGRPACDAKEAALASAAAAGGRIPIWDVTEQASQWPTPSATPAERSDPNPDRQL